jgi:hypothetical protein
VFERFYTSFWHHPLACWVACAAVSPWLANRRARFGLLPMVLLLGIMADAWFTGAWSPLKSDAPMSALLAIVFVIAGDWRFWYLLVRQRLAKLKRRGPAIALAVMLSLIMPVVSISAQTALRDRLPTARHLFLVYELGFTLLAVAALIWVRRAFQEGAVRRWLTWLCVFEIVQYAGWAAADMVIFTAGDIGFLLRIFPNLMYYAAFVPFAFLTAPDEAKT